MIYQQMAYEGEAKDYEFSGTSMREHWDAGHNDTKRTLTPQGLARYGARGRRRHRPRRTPSGRLSGAGRARVDPI